MTRTFHLGISILKAKRELENGNNLFLPTPASEVLKVLLEQEKKGKRFYTGCDNEDYLGMCAGHEESTRILSRDEIAAQILDNGFTTNNI